MGVVIEISRWKCLYCNKAWNEKQQAIKCSRQCSGGVQIEEVVATMYRCIMCDKKYPSDDQANACADKHRTKNDLYFGQYESDQSREILDIASKHPTQKRLS